MNSRRQNFKPAQTEKEYYAMSDMTIAGRLRPHSQNLAWAYDGLLVLGASLALAVSAQVAVPLPFSPVPVTAQTFAVLLLAALLGPGRGAAAVMLYIMEGLAGLPVFAGGGAGLPHLLGPTGGYLIGFVGAAAVVGALSQRGWDRSLISALAAMTLGTAIIFICGLAGLAIYLDEGNLFALGLVPFLPGAALKIILAALLLSMGRSLPGLQGDSSPG